jgi:hypothetical protein
MNAEKKLFGERKPTVETVGYYRSLHRGCATGVGGGVGDGASAGEGEPRAGRALRAKAPNQTLRNLGRAIIRTRLNFLSFAIIQWP